MLITTQLTIGNASDPLIENISLSFDSKKKLKIALVGPNGSGKTTFLKTLVGLEDPTGGSINSANENIAYLSQHPSFPKDKMVGEILESHVDHHWEFYKIEMILDQLGLPHEILLRSPNHLSGGQQLKVQLAELLLKDPTILLLDEPSNHLDEQGINWLIKFICSFNGSILLVSHHRGLLNSTVNRIWEIDSVTRTLIDYPGNYNFWRKCRKQMREQREERFNQLDSKARIIRAWLTANQFHPKYRFTSLVMQQKRKLTSLEDELEILKVSKEPQLVLNPQNINSKKDSRLIAYEITKSGLFSKLEGSVRRGEHIQITGPNGSGKTTILRILAGEEVDFKGSVNVNPNLKIAWLKQHCSLDLEKTVEQVFDKHTSLSETEFWRLLAQFRLKDYRKRQIKNLSGGEQKRVEMALLVQSKPDILLLDEPTNHLDLYVQEELQDFLIESDFTIAFVTHDPVLEQGMKPEKIIELG
jgi:ATPase subunit of ABC transporter with duplicated ATPase domains